MTTGDPLMPDPKAALKAMLDYRCPDCGAGVAELVSDTGPVYRYVGAFNHRPGCPSDLPDDAA